MTIARPMFVFGLLLAATASTRGQETTKPSEPVKPADVRQFSVSPAAEPDQALRYRLIPSMAELNPGDAAPIYLRIRHETRSEALEKIDQNEAAWIKLPLKEFPTKDAREFVNGYSLKTKQLEFGARRQTCDWNYTLPEQRYDAISILLPDAQEMRRWARLLSIKARVEIAEGNFDEAVKTLETGMAFGRHVAQGPFLISTLVGIAIESVMLDRLEELISQPGAPNMYWALTSLPTPLVSLRAALENEQKMAEMMIPELTDIESSRTPAEWSVLLRSLFEREQALSRKLVGFGEGSDALKQRTKLGYDEFHKELKDAALPWLRKHGYTASQLKSMSPDEQAMRYVVGSYRVLRDKTYRVGYVPYFKAGALIRESNEANKASQTGPTTLYAEIFPAIQRALAAEPRLERRIAALRCVEALRMYAAAHDGQLPESLDAIQSVPIPENPLTGAPFVYSVSGSTATLSAPPIEGIENSRLEYQVNIQK